MPGSAGVPKGPGALHGFFRRAKVAGHMLRQLDAYLSATQLGITLASIALGWVGEPAFAWLIEPLVNRLPGASPTLVHSLSLTLSFAAVSVLHIVFGERFVRRLRGGPVPGQG